jgi:hypothetical protein
MKKNFEKQFKRVVDKVLGKGGVSLVAQIAIANLKQDGQWLRMWR